MNEQEASLSNLRDIVVPEPPPFWPPAPGVWVALIIAVAVLLAFVLWWQRARAKSAYRRAGLALLPGARTARDIDVILKRVALAVFPRSQVAPLYGDEWAAFLEDTCSRARFAALVATDPSAEASPELRQVAGSWIRHHHVTKGGS
jgi:hypothetical protein